MPWLSPRSISTALTARVEKVLNEELYWFPVRHHSPAIAAQIADCIRERRPKVVFIEGPHEAQDMIELPARSQDPPAGGHLFQFPR